MGVLLWNGKVISVEPPNTVELEIVETDPGVKGNTAGVGHLLLPSCRAAEKAAAALLFLESLACVQASLAC